MTAVVSALTDVVVTGITGDEIITATIDQHSTSSNTFSLTHKEAAEVALAFNKVATDKYGHVIDYSAVTTADIQALGFKTSAETGEEIAELSGAVIANETHISELSAGTLADIEALSGSVINYVKTVSGDIETVINELSAGTIMVSGYAHGEIAELSGIVKDNELVVAQALNDLDDRLGNLSAVTLTGVSLNNTPLTVTDHVVSVPVTTDAAGIGSAASTGSVADAKAVKEYVEGIVSSSVNYIGATGSTPTAATKGDLYIASQDFVVSGSKSAETGDFIIYNGNDWDVIEKNLDGAVTGNLTADTVTLGNGLHTVKSLANGTSGQVLTMVGNTPGWVDDPELSVVSAGTGNVVSDITVNDHTITFTKGVSAADSADLQTLSGMVETISGYTEENFKALSAGTIQLSADTKNAIAALSAGTIQLSADTKAAIEDLSANTEAAITAAIQALDSVGSASTTGHYLTSVTITDGKITAVGEEKIPAATPVTIVNGGTADTASAAIFSVVTGGTDGHELSISATNKIFSAVTSDSAISVVSAITSVSAQTSVSANTAASADKVVNALSVSGYASETAATLESIFNYDGSAAQSLTFGTNGPAGLKSMSTTSAGVVDVEVIDCGEY